MIETIAILLIAAGIAADNLIVAGISGNGYSFLKHHKWILILLLLFIIENEMLILGDDIAIWAESKMRGGQKWAALGILISIALKMLKELLSKSTQARSFSFETRNILALAFSTSLYVFAFGCATHWLEISDTEVRIPILLLICIFLSGGLILGKHHCDKLLKRIHALAVLLVLAGAVIISIEKIKWR